MPFYVSSYIAERRGIGAESYDAFRPLGSDQPGWSAIDLRPDGGATLGGGGLNACLLYLPVHDPQPGLDLVGLDRADSVGPGLARSISARLKLIDTPISTRWDDLVMEVMLGPPPGAWKPIRSTVEGAYEVWLGGLLKRLPVIRGGTSISENWNCADSPGALTCQLTWGSVGNWGIVANQAKNTTSDGSFRIGRADSDLATSDHQVQATIVQNALGGGGNAAYCGITARHHATTNDRYQWYSFVTDTPADIHRLAKMITGAETTLGDSATTFVANEVLKHDCNSSTIGGYIGGVSKVSVTDTAITGNTRCGIVGHVGIAATLIEDDWSAQDLGGAAAAVIGHQRLIGRGGLNRGIWRV